jgi:beta-glucosidase
MVPICIYLMSPKKISEEVKSYPYWDSTQKLEDRVEDLVSRMNLDEKILLLAGKGFWTTNKVPRLGIPQFGMSDGPVGVAWHSSNFKKNTRLPTSILLSSTWDRELCFQYGEVMGKEVKASGRHMILGPGMNIHRTPLGGRTFEYFTEDPYLNKEIAIPIVKGIQAQKAAACVKHYAANNQESKRMSINAIIGERALEEIYLRSYKDVVKESDPWSIMACYNKVNGWHGCESKYLMKDKLIDEWGFRGFIVSDWFASVRCRDTKSCIKAEFTLEMPRRSKYKAKHLKPSMEKGDFSESELDAVVKRLLRVMFLVGLFDKDQSIKSQRNIKEHQQVSRNVAADGMVLLKNENHCLPLDISKIKSIAVLGPNSNKKMGKPFYGGSSAVSPPYQVTAMQGIKDRCKNKIQIVKDPTLADVTILVVGLSHKFGQDAEGFDKKTLSLPEKQLNLINDTISKNPNTIIVLINGSPISMEWLDKVPAVLEAWYPGMEGGNVIADVLFGDVNPSGKLPLTYPKKLSDSPAHVSVETFPGKDGEVHYKEGIFVGYRHFDNQNIDPLFPFGFGLSYTTFDYSNLILEKKAMKSTDRLSFSVEIENTGSVDGKEIVQVYVNDVESSLERPPKELRNFAKVSLKAGEKKKVNFELSEDDFAFYDDKEHKWKVEPGKFKILIGSSSREIKLEDSITIQ